MCFPVLQWRAAGQGDGKAGPQMPLQSGDRPGQDIRPAAGGGGYGQSIGDSAIFDQKILQMFQMV